MQLIDFAKIDSLLAYKFLTGVVIPRPIAWVTTLSDNGTVNAAPFSFFNVFGSEPPLAILGTGMRADGSLKDTAHNLRERGLAVIHLVDEDMAAAMSATSASLPAGHSELPLAGLEAEDSPGFAVPAIKGTRVRLRAKLIEQRAYGENLVNILELTSAEIADDLWNPARGHVSPDHAPIGRLAGSGYCRTRDRFAIERPA